MTADLPDVRAAEGCRRTSWGHPDLQPCLRGGQTDMPSRLDWWAGFWVWFCVLLWTTTANATEPNAGAISIADFQAKYAERERVIASFRIEGVVCAVRPERKWLVLQDSTAAILLETPVLQKSLHVEDRIAVVGR